MHFTGFRLSCFKPYYIVSQYLVIIVLFCSLTLHSQDYQTELEDLNTYFENARIQWETPGIAVAVVKDGKVLLSKGYGEKEIESGELVDDKTIFSVGSTTKAMTAAAMALLVDRGQAKWTDKVVDHMPEFRLKTNYATNQLTIKDLFTHNSGLGNTDLLWVLFDHSTEDIVNRLRLVDPQYSFRGGYTYQNIMYALAGLLIERLSGKHWSDFLKTEIFEPIGMHNSYTLREYAMKVDNKSTPHDYVDEVISPIMDSNADMIGAAGSVWSCTDDMSKWMNFVLDSSKIEGKRLISKESFEVLHTPHIVIPKSQFYPTSNLTKPVFTTYSLGWFQHDYNGEFVHFHTGSLSGTVAIIGLLPKHNLGVYVFGNLDHTELRHAIMYKVFDTFMGFESRDWSTEVKELYDGFKKSSKAAAQKSKNNRVMGTSPSRSLDQYVGDYENEFLGTTTVTLDDDDALHIRFRDDRNMKLSHWHYDTFQAKIEEYIQDTGSFVSFNENHRGIQSYTLYGHTFTKK